jgi:predicted DNA binding protein
VDRLAMVNIGVDVSDEAWPGKFTRLHPDLLIEVHNVFAVAGHNALGDFEIKGTTREWAREIEAYPDVVELGPLDVPPERGRYRIRFHETVLISLIVKLEIILRYPTSISNGMVTFETVDRVSRIRRLLAALRRSGYEPRLVSLRKEFLRSARPNLTRVQSELFREALASGYFHVPRRITLTQLAMKLSRSKSTVSEMLAIVEKKLAEAASGLTK